MNRLTANHIAVCRFDDKSVINGKKATFELSFHAGILRARPDVDVVMHFQSVHATTLACNKSIDINYFVIPEVPFHIGSIAQIPYLIPGSKALAEKVTEAMVDHDMVIMENHGQVTVARDFDHVVQNAVFFEMACEIIIHAGDTVRPLTNTAVKELLSMRKNFSNSAV